MANSILPGVPHVPKIGQLKTLKVKTPIARVSPLKRNIVQTAKLKPSKGI